MLKLIPGEYVGEYVGAYIYRDGEFFDTVLYIATDAIYGDSGVVYDITQVDMTSLGGDV